jgi:DNA-binding GntR family transcriptional regulator
MTKPTNDRAQRDRSAARGDGTLYKKIVRVLQKEITNGKHPVGARLPTESALCRRFSVSRHTVREALRQLRESGLVSPRQGSGTTVAAAEPSFYLHPVASVTDLMQYAVSTRYEGLSSRTPNSHAGSAAVPVGAGCIPRAYATHRTDHHPFAGRTFTCTPPMREFAR